MLLRYPEQSVRDLPYTTIQSLGRYIFLLLKFLSTFIHIEIGTANFISLVDLSRRSLSSLISHI